MLDGTDPQDASADLESDILAAERQAMWARINKQGRRIIERLRQGRASNTELAEMTLHFTARISELRREGWEIDVVDHDVESGVAWYVLVKPWPQLKKYGLTVTIEIPGESERTIPITIMAASARYAATRAIRAVKVTPVSEPTEMR